MSGSGAPDGGDRAVFEGARLSYDVGALDDTDAPDGPFELARSWLDHAEAAGVEEPTAMVVCTVDASGAPAARTVLLRRLDPGGITFFTNRDSDKGRQLAADPRCSLLLGWLGLHRQIRIEGTAELLDDAASDEYFAGRPRGSQLGAWASPQSTVISGRAELEARVAEVAARFEGAEVPRPPFWGGYLVVPHQWEFWQGRPSRLHDRIRYRREPGVEGSPWLKDRLAP